MFPCRARCCVAFQSGKTCKNGSWVKDGKEMGLVDMAEVVVETDGMRNRHLTGKLHT
jgi:hypothetical protein